MLLAAGEHDLALEPGDHLRVADHYFVTFVFFFFAADAFFFAGPRDWISSRKRSACPRRLAASGTRRSSMMNK
ncbi:hypothetical protein D3C83_271800 [compost metagenome]